MYVYVYLIISFIYFNYIYIYKEITKKITENAKDSIEHNNSSSSKVNQNGILYESKYWGDVTNKDIPRLFFTGYEILK